MSTMTSPPSKGTCGGTPALNLFWFSDKEYIAVTVIAGGKRVGTPAWV